MLFKIKEPTTFINKYGYTLLLNPLGEGVDSIVYSERLLKAYIYLKDGESTEIPNIRVLKHKEVEPESSIAKSIKKLRNFILDQ